MSRIAFHPARPLCFAQFARWARPLLAAIAGALLLNGALAIPAGLPVEYSVRHWGGPDGPPLKTVETILQTRDGYLWFGLNDGLCRFDGATFQVFEPRNTPALHVSYITALAEDATGALWIGTAGGGLVRMKDGNFERFAQAQGLVNEQVKAIYSAPDGSLWIGTDGGGVFVRDPSGTFRHFGRDEGLISPFVTGLVEAPDGALLAVTHADGPFVLRNGRFSPVSLDPPISESQGFSITRSPTGRVWLGTPKGVYRLEGNVFRRWEEASQISRYDPVVAWEQANGDIWVGAAQGLLLFRDGAWTAYPIGGGSSGRFAGAFTVDREGSVWTTSDGGGLVQLRRTKFVTLGDRDGIPGAEVTSVVAARDGRIWVGTPKGLHRLDPNGMVSFNRKDGLQDDFIFALHEDPSRRLWIATRLGGLIWRENDQFVSLPERDRLPVRGAWCLAGTRDGAVWAGTSRGAFEYREGRLTRVINGESGLSNDDVRSIVEDREGTLWIGTSYGLNRVTPDGIVSYTILTNMEPVEVVIALHVDARNDLWIGTMTRGLFRLRNGTFSHFSTREGLRSSTIVGITDDGAGNLWLASGRGIMRISLDALNAFAEGNATELDIAHFGRAAGLRSEDCSGTLQPTVARGADGRLWFATTAGLSTIQPAAIPSNAVPPLVRIERVAIEGPRRVSTIPAVSDAAQQLELEAARELGDTPAPAASQRAVFPTAGIRALRLPPGQDRVEFQYVGLSYLAPESVRFEYRLAGFDREWVDAGRRRVAYYTRLPPGDYQFEVRAQHEDGVLSETNAALAVTILPAWWQRLWLRAAMAFALVGVIITAIARRVRSLQAQQSASADLSRQLIRSQEQERARLAAELHDGLAQQLQLIRNRAELALDRHRPDENAARELLAISATASRAISSVRAITRGLRPPEIDQLGLTQALRWLAELVASSFRGKLEARVDGVDGVLSREDEVHVYRVAQEALNNAVKHGEASEITFEVERRPDAVHLSIYDDGRGFNPEAVAANPHSGSGLKTLKERAVMLGGALELRSEPGVGTRLTLRVPTVQRTAPPA